MSIICTSTHHTTTKEQRNKETEKIKETESYFNFFFIHIYNHKTSLKNKNG